MKRLLVVLLVLASWPARAAVKCSGVPCIDPAGVVSPVTTDPLTFSGVITFNNAANTPVTASDGVIDSTLTATRVTFGGTAGRLVDDADLTFATDRLTATKLTTTVIDVPSLDAANAVSLGETAGCITFEGATTGANENRLCAVDPTADVTTSIPTLATSQTLAVANTSLNVWTTQTMPAGDRFEFGTVGAALDNGFITLRTETTPDTLVIAGPSTSRHIIMCEGADAGTDWALAQQTNPTFAIQSADAASVTKRIMFAHNQTDGVISTGAGNLTLSPVSGATWGVLSKTLTESTPTAFTQISIASGASVGGTVTYSIEADDAAEFQSRSGILPFAAVNKGGTETCTVGTVTTATEVVAVSSGTLTNTFTCSTTPTNGITILADAASSLGQTTLRINYSVRLSGAATSTVTPQ